MYFLFVDPHIFTFSSLLNILLFIEKKTYIQAYKLFLKFLFCPYNDFAGSFLCCNWHALLIKKKLKILSNALSTDIRESIEELLLIKIIQKKGKRKTEILSNICTWCIDAWLLSLYNHHLKAVICFVTLHITILEIFFFKPAMYWRTIIFIHYGDVFIFLVFRKISVTLHL